MRPTPVLLLSATELETAPLTEQFTPGALAHPLPEGWRALRGELEGAPCTAVATGVGKVNSAAIAALAISAARPDVVVLVGIGGAFPQSGLVPGQAVMATTDTHMDTGAGHGAGWSGMESMGFPLLPAVPGRPQATYNRIELAPATPELAQAIGVPAVPFGTADAVTADEATARLLAQLHRVSVESMEGAAVAQVGLALGVPVLQVRGVSNMVGDRNKANWRIKEAVASACAAARRLVPLL